MALRPFSILFSSSKVNALALEPGAGLSTKLSSTCRTREETPEMLSLPLMDWRVTAMVLIFVSIRYLCVVFIRVCGWHWRILEKRRRAKQIDGVSQGI